MTRTQRRRSIRALRRTAHHASASNASSHSQATRLLGEFDWATTTATLDGVLSISCPSPFTNLQLLCPKDAWLIVDLVRVRAATAATPSVRHTITRALSAFARLLTNAETLRPWRDLYTAFWTRVLTSDMCLDRPSLGDANDPWLLPDIIQFMWANGTHIALQWRGRCLEPTQLLPPLHSFLDTVVTASRHHVPVRLALRFEDCQLTPKTLRAVVSLLHKKAPEVAGDDRTRQLLCEASALQELSLRGNILHTHMLQTLASVLDAPATRRIDALTLDSTMPGEAFQTAAYTTAFHRLLSVIMTQRPADAALDDSGVALSLEDCSVFRAACVDALTTALLQATRPLRGLSLACWHLADATALDRFARLLLTSLPSAIPAFDLDVSCVRGPGLVDDVEVALQHARTELLEAALPRVVRAFATGRRLSCRLLYFAYVCDSPDMINGVECELSQSRYYTVCHITDDLRFQLVLPGDTNNDTEELMGWTNWWVLANIRLESDGNHDSDDDTNESSYVLRCAPSGLIVDGCKRPTRHHHDHVGRVVLELTSVTGAHLTRLSMRRNPWNVQQYVSWCPRLEELNADGDKDDDDNDDRPFPYWSDHERLTGGDALQVVHVARGRLGTAAFCALLALPNVRRLGFAHNCVTHDGIDALYETLQSSTTIERVDMRHVRVGAESANLAATTGSTNTRVRIERLLERERTSRAACVAFGLVLGRVEQTRGLAFALSDEVVVTNILSFVDTRPTRVVVW